VITADNPKEAIGVKLAGVEWVAAGAELSQIGHDVFLCGEDMVQVVTTVAVGVETKGFGHHHDFNDGLLVADSALKACRHICLGAKVESDTGLSIVVFAARGVAGTDVEDCRESLGWSGHEIWTEGGDGVGGKWSRLGMMPCAKVSSRGWLEKETWRVLSEERSMVGDKGSVLFITCQSTVVTTRDFALWI
jgi:hypothetical protein